MKKITLLFFVLFAFAFYSCNQEQPVDEDYALAEKHKKKKEDGCECDKEIGITQLSLEYLGSTTGEVQITTEVKKKKGHDHNKKHDHKKHKDNANLGTFDLFPGAVININPDEYDLERLGNKTWLKIINSGDLSKHRHGKKKHENNEQGIEIHTSCSQPIGPGSIFGDFVVISALSGDEELLCQIDPPNTPPVYGDCLPCDKASKDENKNHLKSVTLRYLGTGSSVSLESKDFNSSYTVENGAEFTIEGKDGGKLPANINLNGVDIHVSCSQPIAVGDTYPKNEDGTAAEPALFLVVSGVGVNDSELCGEVEDECETAFAKWHKVCEFNGYVFTDNPNHNPEGYPMLGVGNRWGWAAQTNPFSGSEEFELWAGAGQNDTSKGTLVGKVIVTRYNWSNRDDCRVKFEYQIFDGFHMKELHIYANNDQPTTTAPGHFGNTVEFDSPTTTYSETFEVCDPEEDGIWLIAHAVVCSNE